MKLKTLVCLCYPDWRRRSGEVDVPPDLLNDMNFIDENILKLVLEDTQVRTHFPETWLFEQMKSGYLSMYRVSQKSGRY